MQIKTHQVIVKIEQRIEQKFEHKSKDVIIPRPFTLCQPMLRFDKLKNILLS